MRRITLIAVVCMVLIVPILVSAAGQQAAQEDDGSITIGITVPQIDADGFRVNVMAAEQEAESRGVEIISFSAQSSADTQLSQIEDMIARRLDAIIINPTDVNAIGIGVIKANEVGIPVVAMDGNINDGELTALVESDNVAHGRACADLMVEAAKKQGLAVEDLKVLELLGDQATTSGVERHVGFVARSEELGITIVVELPTMWQSDKAYASTLDAFQANPDINAIFEASDIAMHAGVEAALSQIGKLHPAGTDGHIIITAVDGGPKGLDSVRKGYIDGIAAQQLIEMGRRSAEIAIDAVEGKKPAQKVIRMKPDLVTPENVDDPVHWANQLDQL